MNRPDTGRRKALRPLRSLWVREVVPPQNRRDAHRLRVLRPRLLDTLG